MTNQGALSTEETTRKNAEILHELIAQRAYEIYEARGCVDGFDEQDWLQAEGELLGEGSESARATAAGA